MSRRARLALFLAGLAAALLALNWCVQVLRKPSELAGALSPTTEKTPALTWQAYGPLFEKYSTDVITPELLAALAQVESSGDPAARTYWRWNWTLNPFRLFAPASSAVGLYQITDGNFARCKDFCVRGGRVDVRKPWYDPRGCWFNGFYNRLVPADAVDLISGCLSSDVEATLALPRSAPATLEREQDLAAMTHLCGPASPVVESLRRGGTVPRGQLCGDHDARAYLDHVRRLRKTFARLRHS